MNDLIYNGKPIRDRDEMLCLTDMWRAADCPENKRPAEWARYEGAQFIGFVYETVNMGRAHIGLADGTLNMAGGHIEVIQSLRGGSDPGTWAHWQIGFAYAKYLSPEFHAWCNEVVRAHMEGKLRPAPVEEDNAHLLARALVVALKELEENREDASAFRRIAQSEGSQTLTDTAKVLRVARNYLINWMMNNRWIYRRIRSGELVGYDSHTKNGDLEHVLVEYDDKGKTHCKEQVLVTVRGIAKLAKIFGNIAA